MTQEPITEQPDELAPDEQELDEQEDEEPAADADGHAGPPQAEQPAAPTEKEIERRMKQLEKEAERHARAVERIMGEDFAMLIPSPIDWTPGFLFNPAVMPLNPEQVAIVDELLGRAVESQLRVDESRETCPTCAGFGRVVTGSLVADQRTLPCASCNGNGWKYRVQGAGNGQGVPIVAQPRPVGPAIAGGVQVADRWGRPAGHPHYNLDPAAVGV